MRQSGERLERWRATKGETGTCGAYRGKKKGSTTGAMDLGVWTGASRCHGGVSGWQRLIWRPGGGGRERKSNEVNVKRYERGMS